MDVKYCCLLFQDPILRRSGMYTVAMAYCGSGNNKAIRRLLHVAVSTVASGAHRKKFVVRKQAHHFVRLCVCVVNILVQIRDCEVMKGFLSIVSGTNRAF